MNAFEKLLQEAADNNVKVYDFNLGELNDGGLKGLYMDGNIALSNQLETTARKTCILAEELGHYYTTVGNILNQDDVSNRKQERLARQWAYEKLVPVENIHSAASKGYTQLWEMAEYLDVDEEFLREALIYYGILDI